MELEGRPGWKALLTWRGIWSFLVCLNEGINMTAQRSNRLGVDIIQLRNLTDELDADILSKRPRREEASKERPAHLEAFLSMEQSLRKADDGMSQKEGQQ